MSIKDKMEAPSFKYLRPENFANRDQEPVESLERLTRFHIESFDWMVDQGLRHAISVRSDSLYFKRSYCGFGSLILCDLLLFFLFE